MVKFGLFYHGESQKIISPARGLLNNLNLVLGEPVTVTVDEDGDRLTVVVVEKRESGKIFDSMARKTGKFCLKQGGFGFVDDVYVPHDLASQLEDGQMVNLVIVKKLDKKKNRWGLTAIAVLNESS